MGSSKRFFYCGGLTLLLMSSTAELHLHAQDQPARPENQSQSQDSSRPPGFGQRLTRETREAAGEEEEKDEKGPFKRSASVNLIAKKLGISLETASALSFLFNFGVIAGIIIWLARKYLPGTFRARTAAIQKAMQEAQKASREAGARLAEIEIRLTKLDAEIETMRENADRDAAEEEARIQAATQQDARKMVESAHQEIDAAAKAARRALTAYAADLAVSLARKQIRVDDRTDQALVKNFAGQLSTPPGRSEKPPGKDRN